MQVITKGLVPFLHKPNICKLVITNGAGPTFTQDAHMQVITKELIITNFLEHLLRILSLLVLCRWLVPLPPYSRDFISAL
jgi:hypothetical protein